MRTVRRMTKQKRGRDPKGGALLAVNRQSIAAMGAGVGCIISLKKSNKGKKGKQGNAEEKKSKS